jgi:CheY-like chemotaxis protein
MKEITELKGFKILIVEDMMLVADDLAETLQGWGCEVVGPVSTVRQAVSLVKDQLLDGALLDVNLGQEKVFPVAAELATRKIPFLFLTGYDILSAFPPEIEFRVILELIRRIDCVFLSNGCVFA